MRIMMSVCLAAMLSYSTALVAKENADIEHYSYARVAIKYKGGVGELVQRISQKLNIGYYALNADPLTKISVEQDNSQTVNNLLVSINKQLKKDVVRFEMLNDNVVLILADKNIEELDNPSYVGEVYFDDVASTSQQENTLDAKDETHVETVSAEKPALLDEESRLAASKIQSIVELSKNRELIAKYTRRTQPVYVVENQKQVKLKEVKSTKISTFLIFDNDVDLSTYRIEGEFQDYAQLGNIAAILHRQKRPPQKISITSADNQKATLTLAP